MSPFLSLAPDTFVDGGLIDDVNAKITDAKFLMYDYNGKNDAVPALGLELELEDGTKHESYYSAGDAKYWAPSEDGKTLIPTGDKTSLTKSSKLGTFLTELMNAGFSPDKLRNGDVSCLVGVTAHFQRKADKERKGLVKKEGQRDQSTLVIVKIISLPGEKPKAAAKPVAGQPSTASSAAQSSPSATSSSAAAGENVDDDTTSVMLEVLPANGNTLSKNRISQAVFKTVGKDHPSFGKRAAITQRAMQDDFLKAGVEAGFWEFDGTTVKIA